MKITVEKYGYLKVESESCIFSTNGAESRCFTWSANDLKIEVNNKSDENRFILTAIENSGNKDHYWQCLNMFKIFFAK